MFRLGHAQKLLGWGSLPVLAVCIPRLAVLGALPSTDEGIYAFFSQITYASLSAGKGLPDTGMLMLYPVLMSWVFAFPVGHLLALRLADLVIAAISGWLLYRVVSSEARSRSVGAAITVVFLFVLNQPVFIQAGFKNSFAAALVPLFMALRMAEATTRGGSMRWLFVGVLAAVAVLLRETFIPFLAVGGIAIWIRGGVSALWRYVLGGSLAGLLLLGLLVGLRGGPASLIAGYREWGAVYASLNGMRWSLLAAASVAFVREAAPVLGVSVLALLTHLVRVLTGQCSLRGTRLLFWISIALVPLIEPIAKIGFPYHISLCLVGLAGLCGFAWRSLSAPADRLLTRWRAGGLAALALCVVALLPDLAPMKHSWTGYRANLVVLRGAPWPAESIRQSNYLLAADAIKKIAAPHSTLSASGFMMALFPLTGLLPVSYKLRDLTVALTDVNFDETALTNEIEACPPDIVMTTFRKDLPNADRITGAVEASTLYRQVATVPISTETSYGPFGGAIYKRVSDEKTSCRIVSR